MVTGVPNALPKVLYAFGALFALTINLPAAAEADRRYCFSNICPGDPVAILTSVKLSNLDPVARKPAARPKGYSVNLKATLPGLTDVERATISDYTDLNNSFLLDGKTLAIVRRIGRICAPIGPFVALFSSESGHLTALEFEAISNDGDVRLGVTRVTRSFEVKPGSNAEHALIADLSQRFGFPIDGAPLRKLPPENANGATEYFSWQPNGFQVSVVRAPLLENAAEFKAQADCGDVSRSKID